MANSSTGGQVHPCNVDTSACKRCEGVSSNACHCWQHGFAESPPGANVLHAQLPSQKGLITVMLVPWCVLTSANTHFVRPLRPPLVTNTPSLLLDAGPAPLCRCCSQQQLRSCSCVSKLSTPVLPVLAAAGAVGMLPEPVGTPSAAIALRAHLAGSNKASLTSGGSAAAAFSADADAARSCDALQMCSRPKESPTATRPEALPQVIPCCRSKQTTGDVLAPVLNPAGVWLALRQIHDS